MKSYESQISLLTALLKLSPLSSALRWERAAIFERWGNALLKKNDVDGALAKYRACVEEKERTLLDANAHDDVNRRLHLARNYLGVATLERAKGRIAKARDDYQAAIRTLEGWLQSAPPQEINDVLQEARKALDALDTKR